jgi:hypothetical protein
LPQRLAVAEVSGGEPVDPACNLRLGAGVSESRQPIVENVFPGTIDVMPNLNYDLSVTYKLQADKSSGGTATSPTPSAPIRD